MWQEPESAAVGQAISRENRVLVSALAELETEVQLRGKLLSGALTKARYEGYRKALVSYRTMAPFEFISIPGTVFRRALEEIASSKHHCRSLDRLHLAAMGELGIRRLMTNDRKQATAAEMLGYNVIRPA